MRLVHDRELATVLRQELRERIVVGLLSYELAQLVRFGVGLRQRAADDLVAERRLFHLALVQVLEKIAVGDLLLSHLLCALPERTHAHPNARAKAVDVVSAPSLSEALRATRFTVARSFSP